MNPRLFFLLLITLAICASHIIAQDISCPTGSSLKTDITVFTVSAPLKTLEPILGDFYSSSWQSLLLETPITFNSTSHSRTIHYPSEPLNLTETLLSTSPHLQWHLTSSPFTLPTLPSSPPTTVTYYTQTLSLLPVCPNDAYTTITWTIHACLSPAPSPEAESAISWFKLQHRKAGGNIFDSISRGWFGAISTEKDGNTCFSYDTRVPDLAPSSSSDESGGEPLVTSAATKGSGEEELLPTTTFKTTYPLVPGPATVSWPAGATGSSVGERLSAAARPETVLREEQTSSSAVAIQTYRPENGGRSKEVGSGLVGVVVLGWLLL